MQIVILAGGVGGSRFVSGVRVAYPDASITVLVNTADDITLHGLRISPDLDTLLYTLGDAGDTERGWGRADESWRILGEFAAYGVQPTWFSLGDLDLATHLVRTQLLTAGRPLSEVAQVLSHRWLARHNADGDRLRLLPMSDDRVETHIVVPDASQPGGQRAMHFQEYWVRWHAAPEALAVRYAGVEQAAPAPGVLAAVAAADLILIAPSNPVVSIGPILAVPGVRAALQQAPAPVVGFAGIIGGAPVLGMAHRLLPTIGVEVSAAGVGRHYGARARSGEQAGGILDTWVMDFADSTSLDAVAETGVRAVVADLMMKDPHTTAAFVTEAVGPLEQP